MAAYAGRAAQPAYMQAGHKKAPASGDTGARRVEFDGQGRALQMTNDADRLAGYGAGVKTSVRAHLCLQSASAVEEPAWCDCHASTSDRNSAYRWESVRGMAMGFGR